MKKLLLATSILAGTAGMAAAEITLSGDARMGFLNEFFGDSDDDTAFTSRARVTFTFSGETDGGLAFGASFRADNSAGAANGESGSVFMSGAFGKVSFGDVDGAALAAVGQVDGVGLTGLGDRNELTYIANGGLDDDDVTDFDTFTADTLTGDPSVLYEYSTGGIGLFAAGLFILVVGVVELLGVHEDRGDHPVALGPCPPREREVAVMQRAHRRDHADSLTLRLPATGKGAQVGHRPQNHDFTGSTSGNACSSAGKLRARTSAA